MTDTLQKRQVILCLMMRLTQNLSQGMYLNIFTTSIILPLILILDGIFVLCLSILVIYKINGYAEI